MMRPSANFGRRAAGLQDICELAFIVRPAANDGHGAARNEPRTDTFFAVVIEREGGRSFVAIATNYSASGLRLESKAHVEPLDILTVVKRGYGRLRSEVRWVECGSFGVVFEGHVDLRLLIPSG